MADEQLLSPGSVVVTTTDMYHQLLALVAAMAEVKGALEAVNSTLKRVDDHEVRIRALESASVARTWPLPTAITAAMAGGAASIYQAVHPH